MMFGSAMLASTSPADAQVASQPPPAVITPLSSEPDPNGVNIANGRIRIDMPGLAIPAAPRLRLDVPQSAMPYLVAKLSGGQGNYVESSVSVHYGGATSEVFTCLYDDVCSNRKGNGSVIAGSIALGGPYAVRLSPSGAVYTFDRLSYDSGFNQSTRQVIYYASSIAYPDGENISLTYQTAAYASGSHTRYRVTRMSSNIGYHVTFTYHGDDVNQNAWFAVAQATVYADAAPTTPLAQLTYSLSGTVTDLAGRTYTCAGCDFRIGAQAELSDATVTLPGETAAAQVVVSTIFSYAAPGMVTSVARDGVAWSYAYTNFRLLASPSGYAFDKVVASGPAGAQKTYNIAAATSTKPNLISSVVDELGRTTSYTYDTSLRLSKVTLPEGNAMQVAYDLWGNLVSKTVQPKPGSGLAAVTETAAINASACANLQVLCYRITTRTDALGRVTDYSYDGAGRLIQRVDPADSAGVRRVTALVYGASFTAPALVLVCGLGTTCGTNAEIRTQYSYVGRTALPASETVIDGVAGTWATTTYSYDAAGRLLTQDGPLAGTGDARYFRYDAAGRKTWEIGPANADGSRPATRYTYRAADDKVVAVETGTIPDAGSAALSVTQRVETAYDARRYPVRASVVAGGATQAVSDASFDDRGRRICETVRMNPAVFGSLPGDACALGTAGSAGPDRITRYGHDAAGQLVTIQKAYGTPLQQTHAAYSYTSNGRQASVTDANGNRATLAYDGFDRLSRWTFPSKTVTGQVDAGDYESYGYDAAGNRTWLRKRDGSTLGYGYDGLNRMVVKVVPERTGLAATHTRDVYYGYDLRDLPVYARFDGPDGEGISNAYDGFGRLASSTQTLDGVARTLSYRYDAAGNRVELGWPDGMKTSYAYDAAGRMTGLYEGAPGSTARMLSYVYDTLGRRVGQVGRYGGQQSAFGYDAAGRLTALGHDLAGGGQDVSYGFGYNAASQVVTRATSNDGYAWGGVAYVDRGYAANGLNQYVSAGSATFGYDGNGNLTGDGASSFVYDVENRLVSASGQKSASLRYDPLGRLYEVGGASGLTRFLYDGDELVAEYNGSGALLRRYAHGAGADDPVLWYEGAGTASPRWLHADRQGSIVATSDASGTALAINAYDEWGIPQASNSGRFQYTGQAWLPELGMYHYKARIYSPTLGRFLQTDPVGYDDQINLYVYVGNDPVNHTDPTGLAGCGSNTKYDSATCTTTQVGEPNPRRAQGNSQGQQDSAAGNAGGNAPQNKHAVSGVLAVAAGALIADDATGIGIADDPVAAVLGVATLGALAVETAIEFHANSHKSQQPTEVYHLINRTTHAIDKIGCTCNPGSRYSQAWLARNNVLYQTVRSYSSRYPAKVHENIELIHYRITHGQYPRLNKVSW